MKSTKSENTAKRTISTPVPRWRNRDRPRYIVFVVVDDQTHWALHELGQSQRCVRIHPLKVVGSVLLEGEDVHLQLAHPGQLLL
jgi:hypothetical protein